MIEALRDVFNEVARLPENEQQHIIDLVRQEIDSERRWQALFNDPRSESALEDMVNEALAEDATGETEEIIGDNFLS